MASLSFGTRASGASAAQDTATGPIQSTQPTVAPSGAYESLIYIVTPGVYTARGGGVVTVTGHWRADSVILGSELAQVFVAGQHTGRTARYFEVAVEVSGTASGVFIAEPVVLGVISGAAQVGRFDSTILKFDNNSRKFDEAA